MTTTFVQQKIDLRNARAIGCIFIYCKIILPPGENVAAINCTFNDCAFLDGATGRALDLNAVQPFARFCLFHVVERNGEPLQ